MGLTILLNGHIDDAAFPLAKYRDLWNFFPRAIQTGFLLIFGFISTLHNRIILYFVNLKASYLHCTPM